ncbi:unnamed protein product [Lepeophtheirus salmonis]|uniref:(salmon louse) hypothetical protein n=1 Tax=Lepeophtheirus salmonis TaxID=72036 RepID=A0A7R8H7U1_LEPSM|nr:unnamed protein product [Lepeophtheirus salmonis]CAF2928762.1 unnamed protein product [Lepeophtheirus salmonis]
MRQFRCIGIQVLSLVISIICAIDGKLFRSRGYLKDPKSDLTLGDPPTAQWFDQKLDHFQPTSYEITWKQRYFVNDSFYTNGSPAFIMIGGEGPANPIWSIQGSWIEYAKSVGAICFQLEHRYYGESHPTMDLSVKNLYYLNSEQALADIANFVSYMNTQYNISKWIAFGGSYPGTAVSTSGPVLAKSDFYEYLIVVDQVFKVTDPKCGPAVQEGMFEIERLLQHQVGMRVLSKMFKTCNTLNANKAKDVSTFMESVIGNFEDIVQYNKDNRAFEGADNSDITIDTLCKIMVDESIGQPIERLSSVNDLILRRVEKKPNASTQVIQTPSIVWDTITGQENQVGNGYIKRAQSLDAKFFEDQCIDIFGTHFNKKLLENGIRRTNLLYGGKNPTGITNIVYVHGSFDPWHAMGITKDLSEKATAIFITGTAHCANMYPESSQDPYQLKEARKEILKKNKILVGMNFYGESHPTENLSTENLKYLTSQQAIEDIVEFIAHIKEKYDIPNNKWVTFGALSSSAPVEAKVDFEEYLGVVNNDMRIRDPDCPAAVIEGIKETEALINSGKEGWQKVIKGDNEKDSIVDTFAGASQYGSSLTTNDVSQLCYFMNNIYFGDTNMEKFASTLAAVYGGSCINVNYKDIYDGLYEEWSVENVGYRQWVFQTCNEFGFYKTEQCKDVYGPEFTSEKVYSSAKYSNDFYELKNPSLSNTIITHGSFDPWHPMGILNDMNDSVKAFVINETSHCFDLQPANPLFDSDQLTHLRQTTFEYIKNMPKVLFWGLEEQFNLYLVIQEFERYNHLLSAIKKGVLDFFNDEDEDTPSSTPYSDMKAKILDEYET